MNESLKKFEEQYPESAEVIREFIRKELEPLKNRIAFLERDTYGDDD